MALYWVLQTGTKAGPQISQGWAAAAAAAGWAVASLSAWWFGNDEPSVPWPNSGIGWCDVEGGGGDEPPPDMFD